MSDLATLQLKARAFDVLRRSMVLMFDPTKPTDEDGYDIQLIRSWGPTDPNYRLLRDAMATRAERRREERELNRIQASRTRLLSVLMNPKSLNTGRVSRAYGKVTCAKPFGETHYYIGGWFIVVDWADGKLHSIKRAQEPGRWHDRLEGEDVPLRPDSLQWGELEKALIRINLQ